MVLVILLVLMMLLLLLFSRFLSCTFLIDLLVVAVVKGVDDIAVVFEIYFMQLFELITILFDRLVVVVGRNVLNLFHLRL